MSFEYSSDNQDFLDKYFKNESFLLQTENEEENTTRQEKTILNKKKDH